jgi:hypothetical protein
MWASKWRLNWIAIATVLLVLHSAFDFAAWAVPQGRAPTDKRKEGHFTSPDGRFTFNYSDLIVACSRDLKQSDLWIPVESCEAYQPVCSDFFGAKDNTVACVAYPARSLKGTNFEAAAFSVNQINVATIDGCLNLAGPNVRTLRKEEVNDVTFTVIDTSSVAAGNFLDGEAYRSFHRNKCYELGIRIAYSNIGNYDPGTVREFDLETVYRSLKSVLNTFRLLKS